MRELRLRATGLKTDGTKCLKLLDKTLCVYKKYDTLQKCIPLRSLHLLSGTYFVKQPDTQPCWNVQQVQSYEDWRHENGGNPQKLLTDSLNYQYNEGYGWQIRRENKISSLYKHHIMKSQRRHRCKVEPILEFDNKLR